MRTVISPIGTPDYLFHDGDPETGELGTLVTAQWLNDTQGATRDLQQECIAVLTEAGLAPDAGQAAQLTAAIKAIVKKQTLSSTGNLSEIKAAGTSAQALAREALALGTAATHDVQTSKDDVAPERVLVNGGTFVIDANQVEMRAGGADFKFGGSGTFASPGGVTAFNGATELAQNAIYVRGTGNKHLWFYSPEGKEVGLVYASDDNTIHLRSNGGPSLDVSGTGEVTVNGPSINANAYNLFGTILPGTLQQYMPVCADADSAPYGWSMVSHGSLNFPMADAYGTVLTVRTGGTNREPNVPPAGDQAWYQQLYFSTSDGVYFRTRTNIAPWTAWQRQMQKADDDHTRTDLANYADTKKQEVMNWTGGNFIHLDSCSTAGFNSNNVAMPYMLHTSSNTVVQLAREDWVRLNFVMDFRLLGRTWISHDGGIDAPPGCVFVSGGDFGSDNGGYGYAAVQKNVNGTWYTVAHN
jgi:hypothetical protein